MMLLRGRCCRPVRRATTTFLALTTVVVTALTLAACSSSGPGEFTAGPDGGLEVDLAGTVLRLTARPGTFPPGQPVRVRLPARVPQVPDGRVLATPIEVVSEAEPSRPLVIETTAPSAIAPDTVFAATWDPDTMRTQPIVTEGSGLPRVRGELARTGTFAFLQFGSAAAGVRWLVDQGLDYLGDVVDVPYECSPADFRSAVLQSENYPVSTSLQVYPIDKDVRNGVVSLDICNKMRFAMAYGGTGAGQVSGFALPRSELRHDVRLHGTAGDPFVLTGRLSNEAITATAALLVLEVVRPSAAVSPLAKAGITNPATIALVANSTRSCRSAIDGVRTTPDAGRWRAAASCLENLDTFPRLVTELLRDSLVNEGIDAAAELARRQPLVAVVLGGHALQRLGAEAWLLGLPSEVVFRHRLRCTPAVDCGSAQVSGAPPPRAAADPANTRYTLSCAGRLARPTTVVVRNGRGRITGPDGTSFEITVTASARGSLLGPRTSEAAALLSCTPDAGNFSVPAVVVLTGDGRTRELPMLDPIDGGYPIPIYDPGEFAIDGGRLVTGLHEYAADESHADQPSLHYRFAWQWDGSRFVPQQLDGP